MNFQEWLALQTGLRMPYTGSEWDRMPLKRSLHFMGFSLGLQEKRAVQQGEADVQRQFRAFVEKPFGAAQS